MTNPPDSSLVEDTVIAMLLRDPALQALAPDGVWSDKAGENARRYIIVAFVTHADVAVFGGRGWEDYTLLVKAVMLNATSVDIRAAARRLDELLDDPDPDNIVIDGYAVGAIYREQRIRYTEEDAENAAIRWLHRGGHYRVQVGLPD